MKKKTLLTLHQEARKAVHAPDMKDLSWDDTIADGAQDYANLCKGMVHAGGVSENLAAGSYNDVTRLFNLWMSEKDAFDKSGYRSKFLSGSYNGDVVGHYSQIVWASNSKLGCGYTQCQNLGMYLLVCRYETGNIINYEVYGEPVETLDDPNLNTSDTSSGISVLNINNNKLFIHTLFIAALYILIYNFI
eukprot:jgi/Orpsp1_1/1185919/evm.model.c7180000096018.2